jgi:hypothetical protein
MSVSFIILKDMGMISTGTLLGGGKMTVGLSIYDFSLFKDPNGRPTGSEVSCHPNHPVRIHQRPLDHPCVSTVKNQQS